MPLFNSGFDRIALFFFFTNKKGKRKKDGQHSNLIVKQVAGYTIKTRVQT